MLMRLPDWMPDDRIDRIAGGMLSAKLELRLQQWPNGKPEAKQCQYARGTGDVARQVVFKHGIEAYTLLPTVTYLDQLALGLADEQAPHLAEYKAMIAEVAKRLYDAADPDGTTPERLRWAEDGLAALVGLPEWAPGEADRGATAAISRLLARRLADWPYALEVDEQRAYVRAIAAETAELVADSAAVPEGANAAEAKVATANIAEVFAPITDYLQRLVRECAQPGFDERLGAYRRAAARLAARLLAAVGPGENQ